MTADRAERSLRRRLQAVTDRKDVLEDCLYRVWMWHSIDGKDLETLRLILLRADQDNQINTALDRLTKDNA